MSSARPRGRRARSARQRLDPRPSVAQLLQVRAQRDRRERPQRRRRVVPRGVEQLVLAAQPASSAASSLRSRSGRWATYSSSLAAGSQTGVAVAGADDLERQRAQAAQRRRGTRAGAPLTNTLPSPSTASPVKPPRPATKTRWSSAWPGTCEHGERAERVAVAERTSAPRARRPARRRAARAAPPTPSDVVGVVVRERDPARAAARLDLGGDGVEVRRRWPGPGRRPRPGRGPRPTCSCPLSVSGDGLLARTRATPRSASELTAPPVSRTAGRARRPGRRSGRCAPATAGRSCSTGRRASGSARTAAARRSGPPPSVARRDALDVGQLRAHPAGVAVRAPARASAALVELRAGAEEAQRAAEQHDAGVERLAALDARDDPQRRVLERLTRGHARPPRRTRAAPRGARARNSAYGAPSRPAGRARARRPPPGRPARASRASASSIEPACGQQHVVADRRERAAARAASGSRAVERVQRRAVVDQPQVAVPAQQVRVARRAVDVRDQRVEPHDVGRRASASRRLRRQVRQRARAGSRRRG